MINTTHFISIRQQFNFKSIEMGQWVKPHERDRAAQNFYRALLDLMRVLSVPESVISLRGTLGLQYGKGGQPGVSAHYMPAARKLSLAKNAGAGSLAHEWFHAFDHYIGQKMFPIADRLQFSSKLWLHDSPYGAHVLNDLLAQCFEVVLLSKNTQQSSDMFHASQAVDERLGVLYYSKPEEMCARAFEAFVEDCVPNNGFLVRGSRHSHEAELGLYPKGEQRRMIHDMFLQYFSVLGVSIRQQEQRNVIGIS